MEIGIRRAARASRGSAVTNPVEALKMKIIICFRHLKCICRKSRKGRDYSWHVQRTAPGSVRAVSTALSALTRDRQRSSVRASRHFASRTSTETVARFVDATALPLEPILYGRPSPGVTAKFCNLGSPNSKTENSMISLSAAPSCANSFTSPSAFLLINNLSTPHLFSFLMPLDFQDRIFGLT